MIAHTDPCQPAERQQRPGPRRSAPTAGRAAKTSPPLTGPAPPRAGCPDPREPGRRRGQPVPQQPPDVHRAAQPRTRQLDAVTPGTPATSDDSSSTGGGHPTRHHPPSPPRQPNHAQPPAQPPACRHSPRPPGATAPSAFPPPARRTSRRPIPGSPMRGTARPLPMTTAHNHDNLHHHVDRLSPHQAERLRVLAPPRSRVCPLYRSRIRRRVCDLRFSWMSWLRQDRGSWLFVCSI